MQKICGTYNSTLYVINYYCPFRLPPLINKMVGEPFLLIKGGFLHNAKAIPAGGLLP